MLFAAIFVLEQWEKALLKVRRSSDPDSGTNTTFFLKKTVRVFFRPCVLTLLWFTAPLLLMLGPTLGAPGPDLHAAQPVRQDFVDALHKAEEAVKPQTPQERLEERETKQEEKRAAETEAVEDRDQKVLEGVESFRTRMLNPDIQD